MFVCVFSGRVREWLRGGLFDVHRILILVPFCIFYSDVFDVPSLRVHFSRCWRHDTSCHFYRGPRWLLNSPRCSTTERSGLVRPGDVCALTWFACSFSSQGIPNEAFQTRPYFGGVQPFCLCAELANSAFDDGVPRLAMSTSTKVFWGDPRGCVVLSLPIEFRHELSMDRLLGQVLEFTIRLKLLAGDILDSRE